MASSPTIYPFRQTLMGALRQLILAVAVPAINADLAEQMAAQGVINVPQFDDSSVIVGDMSPVSQATMCILDSGEDDYPAATDGYWRADMRTQIQIKTPSAGDNAPEDFTLLGSVVTDTLRDLFNSPANRVIVPKTSSGQSLLPAGMHFDNCQFTGARSLNFPQRELDKVTYTRGWVIMHTAGIGYFQNRPNPLGS